MHYHCATNTPIKEVRHAHHHPSYRGEKQTTTVPLTPQLQRWETHALPLCHQHSSYRGERQMHNHYTTNTPVAQVRDMHDHCATDTPVTEVRSTCTTIVSPTTQLQRRETHALPMWHKHSSYRSERDNTTTVPLLLQPQRWVYSSFQ